MVKTVWELGHKYQSGKAVTSKYELLARAYDNYRVLYLNDIIEHPELNLPTYLRNFIVKEGAVFMIANIINGEPISILFRSLSQKAFIDYGYSKGVFYGIGQLDPNFKYGDTLIIVEGVADRDVLARMFSNVLATKSATLSVLQVELISSITNKVILALDQDKPGRQGCSSALRRLRERGVKCRIIDHPDIKDPGTIFDFLVARNTSKAKELYLEYHKRIDEAKKHLVR